MHMTFGSLFAGIGGFDLGLERAGMKCSWQVEIDPFCREVLERHWPSIPKHKDVRNVGSRNLTSVDLICGGFPCQDISNAATTNGRKGLQGEKSGLWFEFYRILREMKPSYVLIENVAAVRTRGLVRILKDLASLGYDAEWRVIRASDIGAPHHRARMWVVGYSNNRSQPDGSFNAEASLLSEPDIFERIWTYPPELVSVDDGVPCRVGAATYGNAIVPQIVEWIGRRIALREMKRS